MASYIETPYQPSPSSSGVVGSAGGTPLTSLTSFTPEDDRASKPAAAHLSGPSSGSGQHDPFVSSATQPSGRLSAKASAFEPSFGMRGAAVSNLIELSQRGQVSIRPRDLEGFVAGPQSANRAPNDQGAGNFGVFTADSRSSRVIKISGMNVVATFLSLVEASKKRVRDHGMAKRGTERPEERGNSYYLRLTNIRDATELYAGIKMDNPGLTVEYVSPVTFGQLFSPGRYSTHEGQVLLTVAYPFNANPDKKLLENSLMQMLEHEGKLHAWQELPSTPNGLHMLAEFEDAASASNVVSRGRRINDNPMLQSVTVAIDLYTPDLSEQYQSQRMYPPATPTRRSGQQGDIFDAFSNLSLQGSFHSSGIMGTTSAGTTYMASSSAYAMPNNIQFGMGGPGSVYVSPASSTYQQAYTSGMNTQNNSSPGQTPFPPFTSRPYPQGGFAQPGYGLNNDLSQSQFGLHFGFHNQEPQGLARDGSQRASPSGCRSLVTPKARPRQHSSPANSHHNHVDITKIRQGTDVRTTVMLRNIPNKVDQAMLKEIVDESSFGRYDFMYLRIDFSNNCNVGYAFINFTDPLDIVDFVVARSNQKWHRFKSDKVAEVSYATIQGKDCLVQKFRNSSVMLEPPHYRPKLFKTVHDAFGPPGVEEPFPESDNASKLKRSCENAEHVGLFAPNAGQHMRDEQRRRRSQFDRGTSLAEREEYGFGDPVFNRFGPPPY